MSYGMRLAVLPGSVVALALLVLAVPFAACSADQGRVQARPPQDGGGDGEESANDGAAPVVRYGEPFRLAYRKSVTVERSGTRARFAELVEDSRCPRDVQCIQAGRARVRLSVRRGSAAPVSIELSTDRDGAVSSAGGVTWELQAVEPYPTSGAEQRPEGYTLTLVARPLR